MKISLIDVDGGNSGFPNLALMKLSAWHKSIGDDVDWYSPLFSHPDRIYASKIFNFSKDNSDYNPNDPEPIKGGTGYDIGVKLPDEIDGCVHPDYSIYNVPEDFAYGFLSRGCVNNCPWCVVPLKEGALRRYGDLDEISEHGKRRNIVCMDNNFLACDAEFIANQLDKARRLNLRIDFNQALDARKIDADVASLLSKVKWMRYIRISCDTLPMIQHCREAISNLRNAGYKGEVFVYILACDVDTTLERINAMLACKGNITPFVMPFRNVHQINRVEDDVKRLARWCNRPQIRKSVKFSEYRY